MFTPRLVPESVPLICQILMAGYGAVYLLSIRHKTRATRWLAASLVAFAAYAAAYLLLTVAPEGSPWSYRFNVLLYVAMAASLLALVGFGHTFLARPFRGEERGAAVAGGAALIGLAAWGLVESVRFGPTSSTRLQLALGVALIGAALWALVTFVRQALRFRRLAAVSPVRSSAQLAAARAHATFGALLVGMLGLAVLTLLTGLDVVPFRLFQYAALVGTLGMAFGLVVAFLNHTPERTTVQAKLVGLGLASVLLLLGVSALQVLRPDELAAQAGNTIGPTEALRFEPDGSGGYRVTEAAVPGEAVAGRPRRAVALEAVRLPFAFPFGATAWTTAYAPACPFLAFEAPGDAFAASSPAPFEGLPRIAPYLHPCTPAGEAGFAYDARPDRATFAWRTTDLTGSVSRTWLTLYPDGAFEMAYRGRRQAPIAGLIGFHPGGRPRVLPVPADRHATLYAPAGAALWTDFGTQYRAVAHRSASRMAALVLAAAAFVLLLFPLFLRVGLLRPLEALMGGVQRLDRGDLGARVPTRANDEVGALARSFNRMAGSVQSAQAELRAYAAGLERRVAERTAEVEEKNRALERSLADLRAAQDRLVHAEKMASLGRLTAGVGHEIKNPLNFVVNFASLSEELLGELRAEMEGAGGRPVEEVARAVAPLLDDLTTNAARIHEHGQRADGIVRGMMEHAGGGSEPLRPVDVNALVEEQVALAVERSRARGGAAALGVRREYDASAGEAEAAPNGLGRVVAGMVSNALDACAEHARALAGGDGAPAYEPAVTVRTRRSGDTVTVEVEDNGCGMAETVRARAFEPFFTTKPAGSGHTGLGLSLAHEVVVEGHGGTLEVTSVEGEGTTLTISLPALPPVHA